MNQPQRYTGPLSLEQMLFSGMDPTLQMPTLRIVAGLAVGESAVVSLPGFGNSQVLRRGSAADGKTPIYEVTPIVQTSNAMPKPSATTGRLMPDYHPSPSEFGTQSTDGSSFGPRGSGQFAKPDLASQQPGYFGTPPPARAEDYGDDPLFMGTKAENFRFSTTTTASGPSAEPAPGVSGANPAAESGYDPAFSAELPAPQEPSSSSTGFMGPAAPTSQRPGPGAVAAAHQAAGENTGRFDERQASGQSPAAEFVDIDEPPAALPVAPQLPDLDFQKVARPNHLR